MKEKIKAKFIKTKEFIIKHKTELVLGGCCLIVGGKYLLNVQDSNKDSKNELLEEYALLDSARVYNEARLRSYKETDRNKNYYIPRRKAMLSTIEKRQLEIKEQLL